MKAPPVELIFLVRMWVQGGSIASSGNWRGVIRDVRSGPPFSIVTLGDIVEFIEARLDESTGSRR